MKTNKSIFFSLSLGVCVWNERGARVTKRNVPVFRCIILCDFGISSTLNLSMLRIVQHWHYADKIHTIFPANVLVVSPVVEHSCLECDSSNSSQLNHQAKYTWKSVTRVNNTRHTMCFQQKAIDKQRFD